jgi:hypothetical protein
MWNQVGLVDRGNQVLVARMLEDEGFVGMSQSELEAWNREHGDT